MTNLLQCRGIFKIDLLYSASRMRRKCVTRRAGVVIDNQSPVIAIDWSTVATTTTTTTLLLLVYYYY